MTLERANILVTDDDQSVRQMLQEVLRQAGHSVTAAANGERGLELLAQQRFAVLLLDIMMPGISGIEVLGKVTSAYPETAVLMLTGVVDTKTAVEAMKLGAYDYITKPFDVEEILTKLGKALERRQLELHAREYRRRLEEKVGQQTQRLQEQFADLIRSLAREHALLFSLEVANRSKQDRSSLASLPPELQQPMTSVEQFRDALLRILRRTSL
ncbi:MAG: response regulator [Chloroflexi bacterium]|nr:response regulator [Chloroflexota bacterium]